MMELLHINLYEPTNGLEWCAEIIDVWSLNIHEYEVNYIFIGKEFEVHVHTNDNFTRERAMEIARRIVRKDGIREWSIDLTK